MNEGLEMEIKKYAIRSADVGLLLSFFDDPEVRKELYFTLPERPWPTFSPPPAPPTSSRPWLLRSNNP